MAPLREIRRRKEKVGEVKPVKYHHDSLPAYLTAEELLAYFPEDLYYDNFLQVIGTFAQNFLCAVLTERCGGGKPVTRENIRQRELRICRENADALGVTFHEYRALDTTVLRPSGTDAAKAAEGRYRTLMDADDYFIMLALHQALAAVHTWHCRNQEGSRMVQEMQDIVQQLGLSDKLIEAENQSLLEQSFELLARLGTEDSGGAAQVVRNVKLKLSEAHDADVERRMRIVDACVVAISVSAEDES